jgi:hypothetical protein
MSAVGVFQILPVANRTANGNSGLIQVPDRGELFHLLVPVSAVGATPSLTPSLLWSPDGVLGPINADPADLMTAITATPGAVKTFQVRAPWFQVNYLCSAGGVTFGLFYYITGAP